MLGMMAAPTTTRIHPTAPARRPPSLLSRLGRVALSPPPARAAVAARASSSSSSSSSSQPKPARYVYPEGGRARAGKCSSDAVPPSPPRFYAPLSPPHLPLGAATVALPPEEARHALRVLRLREGDPVELCDGAGRVVRGEVAAAQPGRGQGGWAVTVALLPGGGGLPIQPLPPPGKTWDLVVAAACLSLKSGRDDWLVEKAAELGAAAVLPLATERSPLRPGDAENWALGGGEGAIDDGNGGGGRGSKRRKGDRAAAVLETAPTADDHTNDDAGFPRADLLALGSGGRLPRVAAAATKQCLRTHAPRLLRPAPVQELAGRLSDARGWDRALVATGGAPPVLRQLERLSAAAESNGSDDNQKQQRRRRRLYLVVGPEGDFTPTELEALLLLRGGSTATTTTPTVLPCGLGPNRLRTETAAIAMLSAAAAWVEEREEEGR